MKTSSLNLLLLTIALGCGLLRPCRAAADTYTNIIQPGLNLIANQLDHGANTLDEVLPNVPDGSEVFKFSEATQTFHTDTYDSLNGGWMDGNNGLPSSTTLGAREAVFLSNSGPNAYSLIFTGASRPPASSPPVQLACCRYYYLSGPVKLPAHYTDITGLPPEEGVVLLRWNAFTQSYQTNRFTGGSWLVGEPVAEIGEGVVVWLPSGPPVITMQPQSLMVIAGATASFTVGASGESLAYRWLFNGKVVEGETNATLTLTSVHSRNAGSYVAEVRNSAGTTLSSAAMLTLAFPTSVQVSLGTDGVLSVSDRLKIENGWIGVEMCLAWLAEKLRKVQ